MTSARNKRRLAVKQMEAAMAQRPCGDCTACCTVMAVDEIDKPLGVECQHVCASGCSVYATRPAGCRDFNCIWRYGLLGAAHRPDKLGIVFDVSRAAVKTLLARQVWPGAFEQAAELLDRLVSEGHVNVLVDDSAGTRRVIGPPDQVAAVQRMVDVATEGAQ
jgi:hypothetical protein